MLCLGRGQAILYICINWFLLASAVRWVDLSYQVHSFWALKCGLCGNLVSSTYLLGSSGYVSYCGCFLHSGSLRRAALVI